MIRYEWIRKRLPLIILLLVLSVMPGIGQNDETPFGSATEQTSALRGEIYFLPEGTKALPDTSSMTPVGSIYTTVLDVPQRSFDSGFPGVTDRFEWFSIRYTGQFHVQDEGEYGFRLVSDDGSRLIIDGETIIDNDGEHPARSMAGSVYLTPGQHQIEVDYYQGPRYYVALQLFWTPPGKSEQISQLTYVPRPLDGEEGDDEDYEASPETGISQASEPARDTGLSAAGCTWCPEDFADLDLTGTWSCDDGGTYYITQRGHAVWWNGEDLREYPMWSNVARGFLSNCVLALEYIDTPKGNTTGYSTLILDVLSQNEMVAREKPESYGGSHWRRVSEHVYV